MTAGSSSPEPVERYLGALDAELAAALGERLRAVVLGGSTALGVHVPGMSDVDVLAFVDAPLDESVKRDVAARVDHARLPCPARGLELVVYSRPAAIELNVNTGARMTPRLTFDPAAEPAFWFVRDHGLALRGSRDAIPPVPRAEVVDALRESLAWHAEHEPGNERTVLAACRAWRYAETNALGSKEAAAAWARGRADQSLLDAALARRRGEDAELDPEDVDRLLARAREAVDG